MGVSRELPDPRPCEDPSRARGGQNPRNIGWPKASILGRATDGWGRGNLESRSRSLSSRNRERIGSGASSTPGNPADATSPREVGRRLLDRTTIVKRRLDDRLDNIRRRHELDWRNLLSAHRDVAALAQAGIAPTPAEYWEVTAAPATIPLVTASRLAIDNELTYYREALERFEHSVSLATRTVDFDPARYDDALAASRELVAGIAMDRAPLDRLGSRWQARLHRHAQLASLPASLFLSVRRGSALVAVKELELLDRAPWAYDDRLLWAFEVAHSEIKAHLEKRLALNLFVVRLTR